MWDTIWGFGDTIMQHTGRLDRTQWLVVFVCIVVIGFVCMRGFGSRSNY